MNETNTGNKKRVLWIHNFPKGVGHGGVWMYNQYKFLSEEVELYYLDGMRNPFRFLKHMFRLIRLSRDYEIAHAQYGSAVGFITGLMSCKKVLSLKGSDWYLAPNPSFVHRVRTKMGNILTKISIKRFHSIIVMSDAMKNEVLNDFPDSDVIKIVDPIDLHRFKPWDRGDNSLAKKILFASVNLENPIKRFDLAEQSVSLLKRKMPNVELVTMSNVPHSKVCDFMNSVDVLLLTSTHEGWPNVVKEILACNKPFVATDVSDLRAIAEKTNSCFVCDDSAEQLSEALWQSLTAEPEDLRKYVTEFSMEKSLDQIRSIYKVLKSNL